MAPILAWIWKNRVQWILQIKSQQPLHSVNFSPWPQDYINIKGTETKRRMDLIGDHMDLYLITCSYMCVWESTCVHLLVYMYVCTYACMNGYAKHICYLLQLLQKVWICICSPQCCSILTTNNETVIESFGFWNL